MGVKPTYEELEMKVRKLEAVELDWMRTSRKLQETVDKYRLLADNTLDVIWTMNLDLEFTYVNPAILEMTGYTTEEWIGSRLPDHCDDAHFFQMAQIVADEIERGIDSPGVVFETVMLKKSREPIPLEIHGKVIYGEDGKPVGLQGATRDITERKRAEKEKLDFEDQLRRSQKLESVGTLAGGIAHDFNNLLFPIIGLAEMLMEDMPSGDPNRSKVAKIYEAARRAGKLVNQILSFSRQSDHKKTPVKIQRILEEAVQLMRATIPANIEIRTSIQKDCGLVFADRTRLHQIVMNLMTNAFHAVEAAGGEIVVGLGGAALVLSDVMGLALEPGKYCRLTVADTGCGIDAEVLDKIFEPYFTTKGEGKGTGLGLSVVYGIVKEYGGDIRVHSKVGKGTTVEVFLPLMTKAEETGVIERLDVSASGTESILVVDDEEMIVLLEKQMLERLGYRAEGRTSSIEALNAFKANPEEYDLVITDMTMPNMTGEQFARELLSIRPDIPIIICTGFSEQMSEEKAQAMGIKGFLMKPVVKSDLARTLRVVLDREKDIVPS